MKQVLCIQKRKGGRGIESVYTGCLPPLYSASSNHKNLTDKVVGFYTQCYIWFIVCGKITLPFHNLQPSILRSTAHLQTWVSWLLERNLQPSCKFMLLVNTLCKYRQWHRPHWPRIFVVFHSPSQATAKRVTWLEHKSFLPNTHI
jgi:hypothetical protein